MENIFGKLVENEVDKRLGHRRQKEFKRFDANRAQIGDKTLRRNRPQIVNFAARRERKIYGIFFSNPVKYKVALGKDINAIFATRSGCQRQRQNDFRAGSRRKNKSGAR